MKVEFYKDLIPSQVLSSSKDKAEGSEAVGYPNGEVEGSAYHKIHIDLNLVLMA